MYFYCYIHLFPFQELKPIIQSINVCSMAEEKLRKHLRTKIYNYIIVGI